MAHVSSNTTSPNSSVKNANNQSKKCLPSFNMQKECPICGESYPEDDMYEGICEYCVSLSTITAEREATKADAHQDDV